MNKSLLRDAAAAGLYACDHDLDAWEAAARAAGLMVVRVDLEHCRTKGAILDAFADACRLPEYFGGNWDALDECLRDDAWHEPGDAARQGLLWRIDGAAFAAHQVPDVFETLVEILDDAVDAWRERGIACWVLVASDEPAEFGLDALPSADAPDAG
ncbi:MAG: barstar family protein [Rhodocyclaceae bacterium]|nr:barstar family protein [Rhodocyclaceae bacterium]MCA3074059.1 barstar family protein [Rhodocyclaceae bacterium]MCA3090727.1 barstar family protein [Rhodocyclaceae bacterium]MCA3094953.1 barstar family protein [Rhodocyclaceae bacterium]MCA3099296.1 barstar family protein [Rhodocyclaceae bacterium]